MSKMSRSEAGRLGAVKTNKLWLARYEANPKLCKNCLGKLPYEKRRNTFCDNSCSASFNNIGVRRHGEEPISKPRSENHQYPKELQFRVEKEQICIGCQCDIHSNQQRKYCTQKCKRNHEWNLRKSQIKDLGIEGSVRAAKRYLVETRGVQCEVCGIKEWCNKPVPLVMDHIDGHSDNNKLTNLRLVCGNCDMQLPTYKSKNKGNGRHARKTRYQEGKSY